MPKRSGKQEKNPTPHFQPASSRDSAVQKKNNSRIAYQPVAQLYRTGDIYDPQQGLELNTQQIKWSNTGLGASYTKTKTVYDQGQFNSSETNLQDQQLNAQQNVANPKLKISQHDQLAIHHTTAQPKEFFADPGLITASNNKLKQAGSRVFLMDQGAAFKTSQEGSMLHKVGPALDTSGVQQNLNLQPLVSFASHECNDVMNEILSKTGRALTFIDKGRKEQSPVGFFGEPTEKIRSYLNDSSLNASGSGLSKKLNETPRVSEEETSGSLKYINKSKLVKDLQAEKLGLNEHARPDTGEGYVIKSTYKQSVHDHRRNGIEFKQYLRAIQELTELEEGVDSTSQQISETAQALMDTWLVHYATVMARDGDDSVTIENYNRAPEKDWAIRKIFNKLLLESEQFREYARERLKTVHMMEDSEQATKLISQIHQEALGQQIELDHKLIEMLPKAYQSVTQDLQATEDDYTKMIFFQMYGPGDQSFHKAYQGNTSDPLTLRTGNTLDMALESPFKKLADLELSVSKLLRSGEWDISLVNLFVGDVFKIQLNAVLKECRQELSNATDIGSLNKIKASTLGRIKDTLDQPRLFYFPGTALRLILKSDMFFDNYGLEDLALIAQVVAEALSSKKSEKIKSVKLIYGIRDEREINQKDLIAFGDMMNKLPDLYQDFNY